MVRSIRNPSAVQEIQVRALGREDPLEKGMATHSSILAWETPWTEEPGRATVHGVAKSRTRLTAKHSALKGQLGEPSMEITGCKTHPDTGG